MEQKINIVTVMVSILGALKIVLQSFQIDLITDDQINAIANGVAAIVTIFGVVMSHRKPQEVQHPFEGSATVEKYQNTIGYNK